MKEEHIGNSIRGESAEHSRRYRAVRIAVWCSLGVVFLLVNFPALTSGFVLDDYLHLTRSGGDIFSWWHLTSSDIAAYWWVPADHAVHYFRPVVSLAILFDRAIWGDWAAGFHITNLILHVFATVLVYRLAKKAIRHAATATFAALLFLFHPVHGGAVHWISGRTDLIMTVCFLAGLLFYLEYKTREHDRTMMAVLSFVMFILALLSKEAALSFPVVLVSYGLFHERKKRTTLLSWKDHVPLAVITAAALAYVAFRLPDLAPLAPLSSYYILPSASAPADLGMQFLLYLSAGFFGFPILPFHNLDAWKQFPEVLWTAAVLLVLIIGFAWRKHGTDSAFRFWLLWIPLTLLPSLPVMMGERMMYLPSVGLCIVLGMLLSPAVRRDASSQARVLSRIAAAACMFAFMLSTLLHARFHASFSATANALTSSINAIAHRHPACSRIYLFNAWMPHSLWLQQDQHSQDGKGSREVQVLTLSDVMIPQALHARDPLTGAVMAFLYSGDTGGKQASVRASGDAEVIVQSEGPAFFSSPFERFFLFGRAGFSRERLLSARGFSVFVDSLCGAFPSRMHFRFQHALNDSSALFLLFDGRTIRRVVF